MIFRKAEKEDFYKIRSLYWNLINQEQDDPSFPHWKKGIHPSDEMIQNSIDREELYVLADGDEVAACVIAKVCAWLRERSSRDEETKYTGWHFGF